MDGENGQSSSPRQKDKSLPGHDIFCTPENSNFLSKTPYKTLDPARREIRLIKVLPDPGSERVVECELLPSAPIAELRGKYLALSYCAGNPRNTEVILVNGVKCNVFANLCHALKCARHFWAKQANPGDQQDFLLLWADQICINQADLSERSHQVGFMSDIYESAQQTLVCLSTSNAEGRGMKWFIEISKNKDHKWPQTLRESLYPKNPATDILEDMVAFYDEIIESPWWSRAWVFQEFMVSAHATFLSGHHDISWEEARLTLERCNSLVHVFYGPFLMVHIAFIIEVLKAKEWHHDGVLEAASRVELMFETKASWEGTSNLTALLIHSKNCQASDDRDSIYAFIGLADPGYGIIPDYSADNTLVDVLTETTKSIILFENSLKILSVFRYRQVPQLPQPPQLAKQWGLPSWAVDWTKVGVWYDNPDSLSYDVVDRSKPVRKGSKAIASFRKTRHPETRLETTVMEVLGISIKELDYAHRSRFIVTSAQKEPVDLLKPVNVFDAHLCSTEDGGVFEPWILFGPPWLFILERKPYGYEIWECLDDDYRSYGAHMPYWEAAIMGSSARRVISIF
ncbi:hypothetical protein CEP51_007088 [Fusarium floridanum]|uniref:Heterokaryon incompatibility domain-containing protein n=1 Tax=Fusarium floridanum TaxID=1325733 RepID=A0A428RQB3_9HYPO|nr:hypothetical protein CEP51_007088 [Fusarium floridanum]